MVAGEGLQTKLFPTTKRETFLCMRCRSIQKSKVGPSVHFLLKWNNSLRSTAKLKGTEGKRWVITWGKKKNPREEAICGTETRRDLLDSSRGPVFIYWVKSCIFIAIPAFTGSFAIHPPLKMMKWSKNIMNSASKPLLLLRTYSQVTE